MVAAAPIAMPPARPRLKRSHPSEPTAADLGGNLGGPPQPIAVPVAASPTALPTGAIAWSHAGGHAGLGLRGALDPISEAAEQDPTLPGHHLESGNLDQGGLGLDLSGTATNGGGHAQTALRGEEGDADAGAERRATKRIRVAPDHEAFGRLSLSKSTATSPISAPFSLPAQSNPSSNANSPHSAVPPHLMRQPSQPLPTPPLASSAFPSSFSSPTSSGIAGTHILGSPPRRLVSTPSSLANPPPTHAFSSPTLASASLPSAPPTSPVQPAAPSRSGNEAFSPPLHSTTNGSGVLPTVPWGQSTFFSPSAPVVHDISPPAPPPSSLVSPPALAVSGLSVPAHEIEMGSANASSWDLDPHRIYVASLDDDDRDNAPASDEEEEGSRPASEEQHRLRLNALAARRAAEASALPAALIAQLEREAAKAREGSLVLYRPPPWAAAAGRGGKQSLHGDGGAMPISIAQQQELEKHEESWREFERERQRVERECEDETTRDADDEDGGAAMSDAAEDAAFDRETLVGGDEGGMDVDMEL
ncbi:hypothetical protein JCM10908_006455 [Rhodotorula pacifica]|uniref:uncharacterized protein n=1 Tax=Rhodotorula pacifica TaxID=1495444 RepID=UPI00316DA5D6